MSAFRPPSSCRAGARRRAASRRNDGLPTSGSPTNTSLGRNRCGGFALLLTVTLLAFLVVLLVGLAAYTRIETAVAGNTQRQTQARQNALLGLDVALGQLQKYAGPDQRVTATADAFGGGASTKHFTGVWDTTQPAGTTPVTWLVSGNELQPGGVAAPLAVAPDSSFTTTNSTELVGTHTSGTAGDVRARLVPVTTVGLPGTTTATAATIGRYAWWVGDQGVKAPVALIDNSIDTTYAPYDSAELRSRIKQQVSLGAGPADAQGNTVFEPRDTTTNAKRVSNVIGTSPVERVVSANQFPFLKTSSGTVGLASMQQNFHVWSSNNFNVLASTDSTFPGLRRDLSLRPDLLGSAFAAWANYNPARGGYMEDFTTPDTPSPLQAYSADPVRRRYHLTPRITDGGIEHSVAPVLSFFGISFSVRNNTKTSSPTSLDVSMRCVVGLWNPYSSALVPEDLQIVVTGFQNVDVADTQGNRRRVLLQGTELKFSLPFTVNSSDPDHSSWLPGRVYNWSALSNSTDPGDPGNPMQFYLRDATPSGSGIVRAAASPLAPDSVGGTPTFRQCTVDNPQILTVELRRASDGLTLARFTSPQFDPFQTDFSTRSTGDLSSDFAYVFRLPDGAEIPTGESAPWLQADGRDPRENLFPQAGKTGYVVAGGQQPNPALLVTSGQAGFPATYSQLLLDRYTNSAGKNYNEDAPVFELPRAPLLSLGSLQHLHVTAARPFAVGNSWGGSRNAWFDQFFFSGLTPDITWPSVTTPLPNPLLRVAPRKSDGTSVASDDLAGAGRIADGFSAKFLLQGGAFNLNSVSKTAWLAVLRGVRFLTTNNFTYLNVNTGTGTNGDSTKILPDPFLTNSRVAGFPRFAQSAQETFEADDGYVQSDPGTPSFINNTPLFRRGIRFLSATDVATLADRIVALMQQKQADSGPFRTLAEFLGPSPLFVSASGTQVSLLEKAIEDAGINTDAALGLTDTSIEFSSQWLTQADIMTALAPVLFPRSDTFIVRSYGEAVNPATNATEGRAWCEATVQRVPDYFDASTATGDAAEVAPAAVANPINTTLGRRFKIVSFRWLTRSDI